MNRKFFLLSTFFLYFFIISFSWAQVPRTISYQGVLLDINKNPKPDGNYNFIFKLYDSKTVGSGNQMGNYSQSSTVNVENGVFSVLLDFTTFPNLTFDNPLWLDINVNSEEMSQRVMLASSAYSLGIADSSVTTAKIRDGAVITSKVQDNAITNSKLQDNSVSTSKLQDNSISNSKLQANSVSNSNLQDNSVSTSKLQDNSISNSKLQVNSVSNSNLQDNSVSTSKLQDNSVDSYKLQDFISLEELFIQKTDADTMSYAYLGLTAGGSAGLWIYDTKGMSNNNLHNYNAVAGILGDDGSVWGKTKNFIADDPTNPSRKIRYTSLEGPEAGMYVRGKATLVNGRGIINLPEHFTSLAVDSSITVTLTPRSINSNGLGTININSTKIEVGELLKGTGSYEFDYVIYALRKGYENYKVYMEREDMDKLMPQVNPSKSNSNKKVSK